MSGVLRYGRRSVGALLNRSVVDPLRRGNIGGWRFRTGDRQATRAIFCGFILEERIAIYIIESRRGHIRAARWQLGHVTGDTVARAR